MPAMTMWMWLQSISYSNRRRPRNLTTVLKFISTFALRPYSPWAAFSQSLSVAERVLFFPGWHGPSDGWPWLENADDLAEHSLDCMAVQDASIQSPLPLSSLGADLLCSLMALTALSGSLPISLPTCISPNKILAFCIAEDQTKQSLLHILWNVPLLIDIQLFSNFFVNTKNIVINIIHLYLYILVTFLILSKFWEWNCLKYIYIWNLSKCSITNIMNTNK